MVVPDGKQGLLVGTALDFREEIGQLFLGGQGFRLLVGIAGRACAKRRVCALSAGVRGILANRVGGASRAPDGCPLERYHTV